MDKSKRLAPHESFELHELLTVKNICATKSSAMANLIKDEELKTLMRNDFTTSQDHIRELGGLLRLSGFTGTAETADQDTAVTRTDKGASSDIRH